MIAVNNGNGGRNWSDSLGKTGFDNAPQSLFTTLELGLRELNAIYNEQESREEVSIALPFPVSMQDAGLRDEMAANLASTLLTIVATTTDNYDQTQCNLVIDEARQELVFPISREQLLDDEELEIALDKIDSVRETLFNEEFISKNSPLGLQGNYVSVPLSMEAFETTMENYKLMMTLHKAGNITEKEIQRLTAGLTMPGSEQPSVVISEHAFEAMREIEIGRQLGDDGPSHILN